MKLALLGCDVETLALVESAVDGGEHALVAAYDVGEYRVPLQDLAPAARFDEHWETLLLGKIADAVIVARGKLDPSHATGFSADERRCDQLRKLAQAAVPLLVVHPSCEAIIGYELEMIAQGSDAVIMPFIPGGHHPALAVLQEFITAGSDSPLGTPEQIVFERTMAGRSRPAVQVQLARDVALLRRLIGDIRKVSASGPAAGETRDPLGPKSKAAHSLANLSVHLTGEEPFPARWTVGPPEAEAEGKLTLIGSRGKAVLNIPPDAGGTWVLTSHLVGRKEPEQQVFEPWEELAFALNILSHETASYSMQAITWLDACRDVEVTEAVDRSLERGRAIELYNEEHSEEQSFKGVMAAGGCLMLVVAMGGLLVAAAVEGLQLNLRHSPFWKPWPLYLLVPIVLFLLLQLLQVVAKKPQTSQAGP